MRSGRRETHLPTWYAALTAERPAHRLPARNDGSRHSTEGKREAETNTNRIEEFFRVRAAGIGLHDLAHALEDLPSHAQQEAATILSTPAGVSYRQRAFDVLQNAVADAYGELECERLFTFLAAYPITPYSYDLSPSLARGSRPDGDTIATLFARSFHATINLCAETPLGDSLYIARAGLIGQLATYHVAIVDASPPTIQQVLDLLCHLNDLGRRNVRTYMHCEAGKGRTGVMAACVRMATMGWSAADALTEARNFGLWTPVQEAFIADFGTMLLANADARATNAPVSYPALGPYPLLPPGSVVPTAEQLSMTVEGAAQASA